MGSARSSNLLTRSWALTPSHLYHRAGKCFRRNVSFTYRIFTEIPRTSISRDLNPYHMRPARLDGSRAPRSPTQVHIRPFHRSTARNASSKFSSIPHISVHIAASSSGKGMKYSPEKNTYDYIPSEGALGLQKDGLSIFKKRRARPDSGQDAYFVTKVGEDTDVTAIGICDGVGGWTDHGIDPADFSHGICSHMAKTALNWPAAAITKDEKLGPRQLLEYAYQESVKDPEIKAGGSTACVGIINGDGRIRIANLGDSGFLHLRAGKVQHYSNPQTHAFNTPYQMSITPPEIIAQAMIFGGLPLNDLPERADLTDQMLSHGDVLILATDGVWDNLSSQDVLSLVSDTMRQTGAWERTNDRGFIVTDKLPSLVSSNNNQSKNEQSTQDPGSPSGTLQSILASQIVSEAKSASLNRKRDGPFARAWQLQMPQDPYHGGKVDDITVLVVIPVDNNSQSTTSKTSDDDQKLKAKL